MQELLDKLKNLHGLSPEQSYGILNTIKEFIKDKFPMMAGAVDNLFPAEGQANTDTDKAQAIAGTSDTGGSTDGPAQKGGSFLDKISDVIPGEMGEKAEQFTKDKLGGIV